MQSTYIVRGKENVRAFFYQKDRGIMQKEYRDGKYSGAELIVPGANENYTVNISNDEKIYIFSQNMGGDICLSVESGKWASQVILKNRNDNVRQGVYFYADIHEGGLDLLYNLTVPEENSRYIVQRKLGRDGKWSEGVRLDKFNTMANNVFQVLKVADSHLLVFYQTKKIENNMGYREIFEGQAGNYNVFHTTGYQITDYSFLTTNDSIHCLYIVKSMFSSQLIYRGNKGNGFTNPIVIFEGQKLEKCLLFIINNNLHMTFINNSIVYACQSDNLGESFSKPSKYQKKICAMPVKAIFIEAAKAENGFFCREVYVDPVSPWDVQMLPDLFEDFYPYGIKLPEIKKSQSEENSAKEPPGEKHFAYDYEIIENMQKLRNQYELARKQNTEKDAQVIRMTELMKTKNQERLDLEQQFKDRLDQAHREKEENERKLSDKGNRIEELEEELLRLRGQGDIKADTQKDDPVKDD